MPQETTQRVVFGLCVCVCVETTPSLIRKATGEGDSDCFGAWLSDKITSLIVFFFFCMPIRLDLVPWCPS